MTKGQVDEYLAHIDEPQKTTLKALRKIILEIIPDSEQCISYGVPTFKVSGKGVAGFAAYKNHCTYFPMSGNVLKQLGQDIARFKISRGALQFAVDKPLPKKLVRKLIRVRLSELTAK